MSARQAKAEELGRHAALTWRLVTRAEAEGNMALARELAQLAQDSERQALSHRPVPRQPPGAGRVAAAGAGRP